MKRRVILMWCRDCQTSTEHKMDETVKGLRVCVKCGAVSRDPMPSELEKDGEKVRNASGLYIDRDGTLGLKK